MIYRKAIRDALKRLMFNVVADPERLARVRQQPCCNCGHRPRSHAHHATYAKKDDSQTMPLCMNCHMNLHNYSGPFKGMTREELEEWQRQQIRPTDPHVF
jgi:hypothetical protein